MSEKPVVGALSLRAAPSSVDPNAVWNDDKLEREALADFLTNLLGAQSGGCVINLDGPWGTGKSFFLARWDQSLRDKHASIIFNAWDADTGGDPLASLIAEMQTQLRKYKGAEQAVGEKFAALVRRSGPLLSSLAPAVAKGVARHYLGNETVDFFGQAVVSKTAEGVAGALGKAAAEIVVAEAQRRQSAQDFREAFESLLTVATKGWDLRPTLFVFIDELDRCRPTYAIQLLECVKHLFTTPNAVFVVATDTQQLQHSVRAVYGDGFDAERYLRRFFDVTCRLPTPSLDKMVVRLLETFPLFRSTQKAFPVINESRYARLAENFGLTVRDLEQCHLRARAVAANLGEHAAILWLPLVWLVMVQMQCPDIFLAFTDGAISSGELVRRVSEKYAKACNDVPGRIVTKLLQSAYGRSRLDVKRMADEERWDGDVDLEVRGYLLQIWENELDVWGYVRRVTLAGALV